MPVTRTLHFCIPQSFSGQTVLDFMKTRGFTHPVIRLIKKYPDNVLINGNVANLWNSVSPGDRLTIHLIEETSSENIVPSDIPIDIVYEDSDLLVINKPAGMAIHPSLGHHDDTLGNALMHHFREKGEPFIYRCITRLDMNTSGLVVVARHIYAASLLYQMMESREITRTYLAICEGKLPESGKITSPIGRKDGSIIERCVKDNGDSAVTLYRRLDYKNGYSAALVKLLTGRTHQIRVHFKSLGHPLPGDFLYNPDYRLIDRQALHAFKLSFKHPISGKMLAFQAPIPDDMKIFL